MPRKIFWNEVENKGVVHMLLHFYLWDHKGVFKLMFPQCNERLKTCFEPVCGYFISNFKQLSYNPFKNVRVAILWFMFYWIFIRNENLKKERPIMWRDKTFPLDSRGVHRHGSMSTTQMQRILPSPVFRWYVDKGKVS